MENDSNVIVEKGGKAAAERQVVMVPVARLKGGKFQVMPARSKAELAALNASVAARGVEEPVLVDEQNVIIDGHTRVEAARLAGHEEVPCIVLEGLTRSEKLRRAFSQANRRQLSRKQIRELAAEVLLEFHKFSNGYVATMAPTTDRTIAKIRADLVEAGQIPDHEQLVGLDGKKQAGQKVQAAAKKRKKADGLPAVIGGGDLERGDDRLTITGGVLADVDAEAGQVRLFRTSFTKADLRDALDAGIACLILPDAKGEAA